MTEREVKSIRKAYHESLVILVVEDYMVFAKEIRHALPQHQLVFASSVEDAKARYEETLPNLTFLDLNLPDGDGMALLEHICRRDPTAYVVILSGSKLKEDMAMAQQKGAKGYIIKPFSRATVQQHIDTYLAQRAQSIQAIVEETRQRRQPNSNK